MAPFNFPSREASPSRLLGYGYGYGLAGRANAAPRRPPESPEHVAPQVCSASGRVRATAVAEPADVQTEVQKEGPDRSVGSAAGECEGTVSLFEQTE